MVLNKFDESTYFKNLDLLEDFDIKYIVQDYKQSAVLAGFGITNLYYTHRLLVYENDYDLALKIFNNQKSSLV